MNPTRATDWERDPLKLVLAPDRRANGRQRHQCGVFDVSLPRRLSKNGHDLRRSHVSVRVAAIM
jgi:hypothetical protein